MKLLTKLTLFTTISKLAILLLFIVTLPYLIEQVASEYTNYTLRKQEEKVFSNIQINGVDYYLEGDSSYGSYTLLKEEYIALSTASYDQLPDTIMSAERVIEDDTLHYRVLSRNFEFDGAYYNLEIGKTISSISQYNRPLQRIALYVLGGLIFVTLLTDLAFTRILLKPLNTIIRTKLINRKFPFREDPPPVKTSTTDFKYLDDSLISLMKRVKDDFEREREFTSNASHELMTPIGILQTKMENMLLGQEDESVQERIIDSMKILNRLKRIVNSLLLISRIENDQYNRMETVAAADLVNEVVEELEHRLTTHELSLEIKIQQNYRLRNINRDLVFQLIYNLVNNAIRYNKQGGKIMITDKVSDSGYQLLITDTGVGITAEELPFIFDRFKKSGLSTEEASGLGLAIVKSIADYHGIRISVSSRPGEGSSFELDFGPPSV